MNSTDHEKRASRGESETPAAVSASGKISTLPHIAFWVALGATCSLVLAMAICAYPTPIADADAFVPPIANLARGEGYVNTSFMMSRVSDPGRNAMLYHGFFLSSAAGRLLPSTNPEVLIPCLFTLLSLLSALLSAIGLRHFLTREGGEFGWMDCAVCLLSAGLILAFALRIAPRAEMFCSIVVTTLAMWIMPRVELAWWHAAVTGVGVGIVAATSPLPGATAGTLAALYFATRCPPVRAIALSGVVALASVATFCVSILTLFPFHFREMVSSMQKHAVVSFVHRPLSGLSEELLTHLDAPGVGLFLAAVTVCAIWLLIEKWQTIQSKALFCVIALMVMLCSYYSFFPNGYSRYAVVPFVSLLCGLIAYTIRNVKWFGKAVLAASLAVPALGFVRTSLLFPSYYASGVKIAAAREAVEALHIPSDKLVAASPGALYFLNDYANVVVTDIAQPTYRFQSGSFDYFLLIQRETGLLQPPTLPGFELLSNSFVNSKAKLFGVTLGRTIPGYAFAAYRKVSEPKLDYVMRLPRTAGRVDSNGVEHVRSEALFTGMLKTAEVFRQRIEFAPTEDGAALTVDGATCRDPNVRIEPKTGTASEVDVVFTADTVVRRIDTEIEISAHAGNGRCVFELLLRTFVIGDNPRIPQLKRLP